VDTVNVDLNDEDKTRLERWLKEKYKLGLMPSPSTVWERMKKMGYTYFVRRVRFYVDTHDTPANHLYRREQIMRYLVRESCMHWWIQFNST
jgi:hypothetical protein